jgi:hypothetical protein
MNMRTEMPRFSQESEKTPSSLLEHLDLVDRVDGAFDAYMKAIRTYKKETKGLAGEDPKWHELASQVNTLETAYKALRAESTDSYAQLSAADQELFLNTNAATKKGRTALRESFTETNPTPETLSNTEQESPTFEDAPADTVEDPTEAPPGLSKDIIAPKVLRAPKPAPRPDLAELERLHREESLTPRPTLMQNLRASRLKTLGASLMALFTSGGVIKAVEHVAHELHEISEAKDRVQEIALQSTLDFMDEAGMEAVQESLPDNNEFITLNNVELTRAQATNEINKWYTNLLTESHVPMSALLEDCETQLPNGDIALDAVKCDLLYGNQIDLNPRAKKTLGVLADLSPIEYSFTSEVLRDSVYHRPSGFMVSEGFAVLSLSVHDAQSIPDVFHENQNNLYDMYYNNAYALIRTTLGDVDLESYTRPQREELKEALQDAIQKEIELSNQVIIVSSLMTDLSNKYTETSLKEGFKKTDMSDASTAQMDRAMTNVTEADNAWDKVAQVVNSDDLRVLAKQLKTAHHKKFETVVTTGQSIDTDDTGFYEEAREWSVKTSI